MWPMSLRCLRPGPLQRKLGHLCFGKSFSRVLVVKPPFLSEKHCLLPFLLNIRCKSTDSYFFFGPSEILFYYFFLPLLFLPRVLLLARSVIDLRNI